MEKEISNFKKVVLYLNASSRRLMSLIDSKNNLSDSQIGIAGFLLTYSFEISVIYFLRIHYPKFTGSAFTFSLVLLILFHGFIELFFAKDLEMINANYNFYYSKIAFYLYFLLPFIGIPYLFFYYLNY